MITKCDHCGQVIPHASGIVADPDRGEIRFKEQVAYLTPQEFAMFEILLDRVGRVVRKESVLNSMYQLEDNEPEIKIIDVFICKIRAKLKAMGFEIKTHWGNGYSLEVAQTLENGADQHGYA